MKKTLFPIVVALLFAASAAAAPAPAPKISAKEVRYDAGRVKQGTKVSHVFEIANAGTAQLVIESLQPG